MKFLLIDEVPNRTIGISSKYIAQDDSEAGIFMFPQFQIREPKITKYTVSINAKWEVFCCDISLIPKKYQSYFKITTVEDEKLEEKIIYFFENLGGIFLHTLSGVSKLVKVNISEIKKLEKIPTKRFLTSDNKITEPILIDTVIITPSNLVVTPKIYEAYSILEKKLNSIPYNLITKNVFFDDFILSLLPEKYWSQSLFYLNSKLQFKISKFYNTYTDIISLHIPVARSKYIRDLFESLLLQTDKRFKIHMWVDGYNEEHKKGIISVIKEYEHKFENFDYFVNRKNLGVWKTRWKLLKTDLTSKYIVFLDDDNFISSNTIEELNKQIAQYPKCGMYSIPNIDVRFDVDYKEYIDGKWPFNQPVVYTNRERINKLPLYCDQEETPLIHNRYYSDLLDIEYHETFDSCSVDMVFNRFLEIVCGNINFEWMYQFMRVWHQYHQTRSDWFNEKEFRYVMYILKVISYLNNNNYYYTYLIKTQVPKQNELFTKN